MSRVSLARPYPTEEPELGQLMDAARAGDRDSFSQIYRRYHRSIYAVCYSIVRDHALAEDAAHDTYLRAMTNLDRFDSERQVWPWLAAIARRRSIDIVRERSNTDIKDHREDERGPSEPAFAARDDGPFDHVARRELRREIRDALKTLPARQRRAVLLYALEGWGYSEIADAEGISITAIKSIIWRARGTLRRSCASRAMGALLFPFQWIAWRSKAALRRVKEHANEFSALGSVAGQPILAGMLGLTVLFGTAVVPQAIVGERSGAYQAAMVAQVGPGASAYDGASDSAARAPSREDDVSRVTNDLIDPTRNATPDSTQFTSIVASPSYRSDHTMFAAGKAACWRPPCSVLFRSSDGGATWVRLAAQDFAGDILLLPPAFPADARIFALGASGLQQSADGGRTFVTVAPAPAFKDVQMSPRFNDGDPRILIGANAVLEYRADHELLGPTLYGVPGVGPASVSFSPTYALDRTVLVGGSRMANGQLWASLVNRCTDMGCTEQVLEGAIDVPSIRSAPQGSPEPVVAAFTEGALFVSDDGGSSFIRRQLPETDGYTVKEVAFALSRDAVRMFAAVHHPNERGSSIFSTEDSGATWTSHTIDIATFERGADLVALTPSGRVFAGGVRGGIACSSDGGVTWAKRCGPER